MNQSATVQVLHPSCNVHHHLHGCSVAVVKRHTPIRAHRPHSPHSAHHDRWSFASRHPCVPLVSTHCRDCPFRHPSLCKLQKSALSRVSSPCPVAFAISTNQLVHILAFWQPQALKICRKQQRKRLLDLLRQSHPVS